MFVLADLTNEDKKNFLRAIASIIRADGDVDEAEKAYLATTASAYGLPEKSVTEVLNPPPLEQIIDALKKVKSARARRYLVRELVSVALTDGSIDDDEMDIVYSIGEALGVAENRMDEMLEWALEGYQWQLDGLRLVKQD